MRALVTGATGFIGFHTCACLLREGHEVRALVRTSEKAERVLLPLGLAPSDLIVGDMCDTRSVTKALEGCDATVHAAASVSVSRAQTDFSSNLDGTVAVVGESCERGLETLYVSSLTAIFDPEHTVNDESPLVRSKSNYARSKAECDAWVRAKQASGAPLAIVYPPGVVGPDDPGFSESVRAFRSFLRGTLKSDGGIPMVDSRDLALLITRMLERKVRGRVVAAGHFLAWDEFTELLESVTGAKIPRIAAPGWLLRAVARSFDIVGEMTGKMMPLTGEGVELATRFCPVEDSPLVAELGLRWREPTETLTDLFRWFVEAGKLPPKAVPSLRASAEDLSELRR